MDKFNQLRDTFGRGLKELIAEKEDELRLWLEQMLNPEASQQEIDNLREKIGKEIRVLDALESILDSE